MGTDRILVSQYRSDADEAALRCIHSFRLATYSKITEHLTEFRKLQPRLLAIEFKFI
jgi:hypothetical protein